MPRRPESSLAHDGVLPGSIVKESSSDPETSEGGEQPATVDISSLSLEGSPRLAGENEEHTRTLVEASATLPPVLVHRTTMRVIDGVHRVRAAKLRGERTISAVFFEGDADAAFVEAVKTNIAHGLPLTLADRRAAAERILRTHGGWSDRAVAAVTGLAAATVRSIRYRVTDRSAQLHTRLGRDGKLRPLDASDGRRRAAKVITERPNASLREVASAAGVSTRTVRDVRARVRNGSDPVPAAATSDRVKNEQTHMNGHSRRRQMHSTRTNREPSSVLEGIRKDPSLRYSENGRAAIRWLVAHFVSADDESLVRDLPPHAAYTIAELASLYADTWRKIANELLSRAKAASEAATR